MKELLPFDVRIKDAATAITSKMFLDSWNPSFISAEVHVLTKSMTEVYSKTGLLHPIAITLS